ncbi:CBS domain-containing protein [Pseudohalocynthiibacter aestuariivivens]|jgi:CBS domain-containing protein|uniref:CBS domain-containing protein n=1 Tax=Pseudohalocynthiibacter aestuariivivens TaxID=1591409 RepID=A0ABV5JHR1_9RHOB|nr:MULTISPECIES: CBS domain-containing protein [Pseudohalocynthiibacter]MBS9716436.1 CBS domain-containing protein [Pseudohalocynthiibacter aestuariivivens]MCK0100755.1 CBS domain-containing protein [Pseudohalocynthiibacter sp. F2068]
MLVHQILKSKTGQDVVSIEPGSKVSDAATILSERKIGTVVVSKDGNKAEGILSERDIVRELGKRGPSCMSDKVDDLMTRDIVTCAPGDKVDAILQMMTEGRFRHMPVLEGGKMIGVISIGDVVKAQLAELAMEKEALQGMIMGH